MSDIDIDSILQTTLEGSKALAKILLKKYVQQATDDTNGFLQRAKEGIARATALYAQGAIAQDDLEDLIMGKKDLAAMHALKQAGLASATIDTFTNGVLNLLLDAVLAAIP
jgi:hypothetical protein